jgi:Co/Zn/Cd efflux system component
MISCRGLALWQVNPMGGLGCWVERRAASEHAQNSRTGAAEPGSMSQTRGTGCGCAALQAARLERRTHWTVLAINAAMFMLELGCGLRARSTGLMADSLGMRADAAVYALSLLAVGRSSLEQRRVAGLSGLMEIALAGWVLADVLRRWLHGSRLPDLLIGAAISLLVLRGGLRILGEAQAVSG